MSNNYKISIKTKQLNVLFNKTRFVSCIDSYNRIFLRLEVNKLLIQYNNLLKDVANNVVNY